MTSGTIAGAGGRDAQGVYAFFDIDGTLVYRDEQHMNGAPTERVSDALRAFVAAGGACVLCTGRPREMVVPEVAALPFSGYVTMDGAHVDMGDRVVRDVAIPSDLVRAALLEMERLDITMLVESAGVTVVLDRGRNWWQVPCLHTAQEVIDARPDLRFSKFAFHDCEMGKVMGSDLLRKSFVLYRLGDGINELTVEGISKGDGMRAYLEALPVRPRRTLAFGDSENDLPMMEVADVPVCMGNARPSVLEHARRMGCYIADSVLDDGVASALDQFGYFSEP